MNLNATVDVDPIRASLKSLDQYRLGKADGMRYATVVELELTGHVTNTFGSEVHLMFRRG